MNFDSHTSDVVATAVAVVNLLVPGHARGREYRVTDPRDELRRLLSPRSSRPGHVPTAAEIDQLSEYAARLYAVFADVDAGNMDDACERTNAVLWETRAAPVLARHDNEPWHLHFHAIDDEWARNCAASMATGLAVVLGNPVHDRLGVCTASACDRVFVDTSRNGTRRFCSTACQNRVKAAAFRERKRG
ncbi:CGNR zinc finger domain-containing protein [Haloechinothrix halophila]|uniref:CGNR zinc finger domain-containing protein n=1 Tax=Haloechinothrix halophila TaxID=1069073 RepID=UPI0003FFD142|nr:CGNR zinc finger domain-containing protein [Haloechinothrix halophila]